MNQRYNTPTPTMVTPKIRIRGPKLDNNSVSVHSEVNIKDNGNRIHKLVVAIQLPKDVLLSLGLSRHPRQYQRDFSESSDLELVSDFDYDEELEEVLSQRAANAREQVPVAPSAQLVVPVMPTALTDMDAGRVLDPEQLPRDALGQTSGVSVAGQASGVLGANGTVLELNQVLTLQTTDVAQQMTNAEDSNEEEGVQPRTDDQQNTELQRRRITALEPPIEAVEMQRRCVTDLEPQRGGEKFLGLQNSVQSTDNHIMPAISTDREMQDYQDIEVEDIPLSPSEKLISNDIDPAPFIPKSSPQKAPPKDSAKDLKVSQNLTTVSASRITQTNASGEYKNIPRNILPLLEQEFNFGDDDILDKVIFTLKDPLTATKIKLPVKSDNCGHFECFDFENFCIFNQIPAGIKKAILHGITQKNFLKLEENEAKLKQQKKVDIKGSVKKEPILTKKDVIAAKTKFSAIYSKPAYYPQYKCPRCDRKFILPDLSICHVFNYFLKATPSDSDRIELVDLNRFRVISDVKRKVEEIIDLESDEESPVQPKKQVVETKTEQLKQHTDQNEPDLDFPVIPDFIIPDVIMPSYLQSTVPPHLQSTSHLRSTVLPELSSWDDYDDLFDELEDFPGGSWEDPVVLD